MSLIQLALRHHRRPPEPVPASLPVVVPASGSAPATLRLGSSVGPRWNIKGMNVWGLQSPDTNSTFGLAQYTNRAVVASTINGWGANMIRFRILADDYNAATSTTGLTKPQIISRIVDWRDTAVARGMYFCPCSWDALDGAFSDAAWAGNGFRVHQMFADIYAALGDDPMVIYEPTNEPNSLGSNGHDTAAWDAWQANMEASILYFRETMGYLGVMVIDPLWWGNSGPTGNGYDDARYTALESYDASHSGMEGNHQLVFAKHDYHDNYPSSVWNSLNWSVACGGASTNHLIWENEFGNYNNGTSNATWASAAAQTFAGQFDVRQNFVGAAPFLHGPWFDANATTTSDNVTTTTWGQTVKVDYFENVPPPPPPPPTSYPPLKVPQHTTQVTSLGYRSAPATEFRDSIGITSPVGTIGHISDASRAAPPGSGASSFADFHCKEMQYLGIRQLRTTPNYTVTAAMNFVRMWGQTQVGSKTGKLCVEPGTLMNNTSANNPRCSGVFDSICCGTIDSFMNAVLADPLVRNTINILELLNEPDGFHAYQGVNGPNTPGTDGRTWLECVGEYNKKVWEKYIVGDPRCAGMQTCATCPTGNYMDDSEWSGQVPDGLDVDSQWGPVLPYTQFGNDHPYCGHTKPGNTFRYNHTGTSLSNVPYANLPDGTGWPGMMRGHGAWPTRRFMVSEFGYVVHRTQVGAGNWWSLLPDFEVFANYFLRTYLEAFIRGYERVYYFNLFPQGFSLPRGQTFGVNNFGPDDYCIYEWDTASPRYWWHRTQAVEAMHRMTSTIGDGTAQPDVPFTIPSPHSSLRWLMLRNISQQHVLCLWRDVHFVQQPGVPLGQHDTAVVGPSKVTVAPITVRVNVPSAAQIVETHPLDGAANTTLAITGSGSSRGVDVSLAEKPFLLVITTTAPPPPPPPATLFAPGMMFNADLGAADAGQNLGAKVMRVEFSINNNVGSAGAARTTMDQWVDYYADRGIRMLMLAGFDGPSAPSVAQAQNVGSWAARYGSGGTFWVGRTDGALAVKHIEFGNELNYNYQAGGTNAAQAQAYGARCVTAYNSIQATGRPVGLLAMGMPSDSGAPEWLNNMFIGASNLASIIAGWVIHPYGPDYAARVASHASQLSSHGVPTSVPIDITEIGVSTDNGRAVVPDNNNWSTTMTYAQAGTTMTTVANTLRNGPQGSRLRHFLVYQTRDQDDPGEGATARKEGYFGVLRSDDSDKAGYSPAVRTIMTMT